MTTTPNARRGVRLREADRGQLSWGPIDLDGQLPEDHPARAIWTVVGRLELAAFYSPIEARHGVAGAPAIDPDGTRIRASAGAASFRRGETLDALMRQAREHLDAVTKEGQDPDVGARRAAARKRGAAARLARLEEALEQLPEVVETRRRSGSKDASARVSTTDPDARVRKPHDRDPHTPLPDDSEAVAAWRTRMATDEVLFALTVDVLRLITLGG